MKRLILLATLCVAGLAVIPAASAVANETGSCEIKGEATFSPGLSKTLSKISYSFSGKSKCTPSGREGTTSVKGEGELQCAVAAGGIGVVGETGAPGKGELFVGTSEPDPFELSFVAQAGVVDLLARPAGETAYTASGEAEFLSTNGPTAITQCAEGALSGLKFEAQTAGTI